MAISFLRLFSGGLVGLRTSHHSIAQKRRRDMMDPCAEKTIHRRLLVSISIPIFIVVRNRALSEQAGKIVGVYGIAQEKRPGHMEDFLHGAQIRRVREKDRAGERDAVHVGVSPG